MAAKCLPDLTFLNECFNYDGCNLLWKERPLHHFVSEHRMKIFNATYSNKPVGTIKKDKKTSYLRVNINGEKHYVHRIIYKIFHGEIDMNLQIDHKDRNGLNNKIDNLREVTQSTNMKNSSRYINKSIGDIK